MHLASADPGANPPAFPVPLHGRGAQGISRSAQFCLCGRSDRAAQLRGEQELQPAEVYHVYAQTERVHSQRGMAGFKRYIAGVAPPGPIENYYPCRILLTSLFFRKKAAQPGQLTSSEQVLHCHLSLCSFLALSPLK